MPTAVPVHSHITYACPKGWRFEAAPFALPYHRVTCTADGKFNNVDEWPVCADIFACKGNCTTTSKYHYTVSALPKLFSLCKALTV